MAACTVYGPRCGRKRSARASAASPRWISSRFHRRRSWSSSKTGSPFGPMRAADRVRHEPTLREYPYLPGVRADLLFKLKRFDEAKKEFERAASLTSNTGQRKLLLEKAAEC